MASPTLPFLICTIFLITCANGAGAAASAPTVDCSTLVLLNLADCLSFVTNGSTINQPEGRCCSGLKTVLKTDGECLCEAFRSSPQLGIVLNITKALTLPPACNLHAPSASNCGLSLNGPAAAPGLPPSSTPVAAAPTVTAGASLQAPAPSQGDAGSHGLSISVGSLAIGLLIALFSSF